jgi:peroxiredoxin
MRRWLIAAGAYNLLWGAATIAAPVWTLRTLGVTTPDTAIWPQLWACVGMIVGVYGIGYLIAARDPLRHWPIVLVGLLGKIFGPIGFIDAAFAGDLPWRMGFTLLTNDLLWWIPFTMILWAAANASQPRPDAAPVSLADALQQTKTHTGQSLATITHAGPTLVVLLRHAGCTFCREAIADLAHEREKIRSTGMPLVVVGMSAESDSLRAIADKHHLRDVEWVADPDRLLYRALELRRGNFLQLFGPIVWIRGMLAGLKGHGIGTLEGDGFQMPGAFVIDHDRVLRAYRHRTAADRPDYVELACPLN